jgi:methyltransferase
MSSQALFTLLVMAFGIERLIELKLSREHARWSRRQGGVEFGRGHYPPMVVLHSAFLLGCALEPWLAERPFVPALGWPMLAIALGAQGLRWWSIASLGRRWNTRVIVVPGRARERSGPYRWLDHPNYVAVVAEGIALPLIHQAWLTALLFTALNAALLPVRIRCENKALSWAESRAS